MSAPAASRAAASAYSVLMLAVSVIWHYKAHYLSPRDKGATTKEVQQPDEETKTSLPV